MLTRKVVFNDIIKSIVWLKDNMKSDIVTLSSWQMETFLSYRREQVLEIEDKKV